jgi:hypothetical protein
MPTQELSNSPLQLISSETRTVLVKLMKEQKRQESELLTMNPEALFGLMINPFVFQDLSVRGKIYGDMRAMRIAPDESAPEDDLEEGSRPLTDMEIELMIKWIKDDEDTYEAMGRVLDSNKITDADKTIMLTAVYGDPEKFKKMNVYFDKLAELARKDPEFANNLHLLPKDELVQLSKRGVVPANVAST